MPDKKERTFWKEARTGEPLLGLRRVPPLRSEGSPAVGGGQPRTQRPLGGWRRSAPTHCFCRLPGAPEPGWEVREKAGRRPAAENPGLGLDGGMEAAQSGQSVASSHSEPRHTNMYVFLLH